MSDTGYIYAVICAIMMVMQSMVAGACIERLLTGRDDRISKRKEVYCGLYFAGRLRE